MKRWAVPILFGIATILLFTAAITGERIYAAAACPLIMVGQVLFVFESHNR
jgi:hypothetical protein